MIAFYVHVSDWSDVIKRFSAYTHCLASKDRKRKGLQSFELLTFGDGWKLPVHPKVQILCKLSVN